MALRLAPRTTAKLALTAAVTGAIVAGLKGQLSRFEVVESSMEPALSSGDYVVAVSSNSVRRGDIVVYPDPAAPDRDLIKRAIGLPGETVTVEGGQVAIDGALLAEPWADGPTLPDGSWECPPGTILTLGDNRRMSSGDGRTSGPVALADIYRVTWRYWPPSSFGRL